MKAKTLDLMALKGLPPNQIQTHVSLKNFSYLKTGGTAEHLITLQNQDQMEAVLNFLNQKQLPYLVLGRATNILIKEGDIHTVILQPQFYHSPTMRDDLLWLPSSIPLIRGLKIAQDLKLKGMEYVMGIPGSVGGAVVMNAGVKDSDTKQVLKKVKMFREGNIVEVSATDLDLRYRHSNVASTEVIVEAGFALEEVSKDEINHLKSQALLQLELRKKTQPLKMPSLGSTFKNPLPEYAGALIEQCQLKGMSRGGISVSHQHANFIVNHGGGTTDQALELIAFIQETVASQTGITLELEARKFGF